MPPFCGFWPGNGGYGRAAFHVYAHPEPAGYGDTRLSTAGAFYDKGMGQFILPVRGKHRRSRGVTHQSGHFHQICSRDHPLSYR